MRHLALLLMLAPLPAIVHAEKPAQTGRIAAEKTLCRSYKPTGSLMMRRNCHTEAEWRQIDERSNRAFVADNVPTLAGTGRR